jgi:hypothetical protein
METYALYVMGISGAVFIGTGAYLHILRMRASGTVRPPFMNPRGKRKPVHK